MGDAALEALMAGYDDDVPIDEGAIDFSLEEDDSWDGDRTLACLFSMLSLQELTTASAVCKQWQRCSRAGSLWAKLQLTADMCQAGSVKAALPMLLMRSAYDEDDLLLAGELTMVATVVGDLDVSSSDVDDDVLQLVADSCTSLWQLKMNRCYAVTTTGFNHFLVGAPQLALLEAWKCYRVESTAIEPFLEVRPDVTLVAPGIKAFLSFSDATKSELEIEGDGGVHAVYKSKIYSNLRTAGLSSPFKSSERLILQDRRTKLVICHDAAMPLQWYWLLSDDAVRREMLEREGHDLEQLRKAVGEHVDTTLSDLRKTQTSLSETQSSVAATLAGLRETLDRVAAFDSMFSGGVGVSAGISAYDYDTDSDDGADIDMSSLFDTDVTYGPMPSLAEQAAAAALSDTLSSDAASATSSGSRVYDKTKGGGGSGVGPGPPMPDWWTGPGSVDPATLS
eukprot:PLAT5860.1.p1 GENE.PLAT5860.1~~PLAT5860.1.p1  ORF type:complete len:470 (-),score=155.99 PLAT5860.1:80-1432(-)